LKLGWRLSDSIDIEPLLIDHLVRIASMSMNLQTVREGLVRHAWTEPQLMEMQTNLAALDLLKEYGLAMRGERALLVGSIEYLRRHSSAESPLEYQLDGGGQNSWRPPLPAFPSGWFYQNIVTMCRLIQEFTLRAVDEQTRRVFPWISDRGSNALAAMRLNPYNLLAKILMPALDRAANRSARMQTYADAARVACALERYRQVNKTWPESLEPLVPGFIGGIPRDVIDGKPLRYRRSPDRGYILYSIGWNQRDDGGQVVWAKDERESPRDESRRDGRPRVDFTQGDWVWSMPR
jgi:hypothetical protein